jgi:hypothetical protein
MIAAVGQFAEFTVASIHYSSPGQTPIEARASVPAARLAAAVFVILHSPSVVTIEVVRSYQAVVTSLLARPQGSRYLRPKPYRFAYSAERRHHLRPGQPTKGRSRLPGPAARPVGCSWNGWLKLAHSAPGRAHQRACDGWGYLGAQNCYRKGHARSPGQGIVLLGVPRRPLWARSGRG